MKTTELPSGEKLRCSSLKKSEAASKKCRLLPSAFIQPNLGDIIGRPIYVEYDLFAIGRPRFPEAELSGPRFVSCFTSLPSEFMV